jgi:hypothetical protein
MELLNGGASQALEVLTAAAPELQSVAAARHIDAALVGELQNRAETRLRDMPEPDAVFEAAAEAASLLYIASWLFSHSASTEELRQLL